MINLDVRRKPSGIPILSRKEIDRIAEAVLMDYDSKYVKDPQPVNIELFAQEYLKMEDGTGFSVFVP